MVVLGNPPYSGHSANTGAWIAGLLRGHDAITGQSTGNYFACDGQPLGERNPKWLNDDYVKFIRFAQWRIEQTGHGILGFVTNHGYLDNPTFRGMRESLLRSFDTIYLLDLHGNSKKKERTPDGGKDENVFDIQQGVAIGIFVRKENGQRASEHRARVFHADLHGTRAVKYASLDANDIDKTEWHEIVPASPTYYFVPEDGALHEEYGQGWKITEAMPVNSVGIVTARDQLTIHITADAAWSAANEFASLNEQDARSRFDLREDSTDWSVSLAQKDLRESGPRREQVAPILYRPFDVRHTYFTGHPSGFHARPRGEVMCHLVQPNLALLA
ncbi:adenine specific DNA methyltransferase, partial [mine drainage metagenome]